MKYKYFKVEDFVKDDYFQKWVLNNDAMVENFWVNWLKNNPDKEFEVKEARALVSLLAVDHDMLADEDFDSMWQNIVQEKATSNSTTKSKSSSISRLTVLLLRGVAAMAGIIILALGVRHYILDKDETIHHVEPAITLELDDGTILNLNTDDVKDIRNASGEKLISQNKSRLDYSDNERYDNTEVVYNKLTVPYGKKFQLNLSDDTHVYLNSGSSLRYPINFLKDKAREVFLDGEAYFTVAEDKKRPFTVITDDMNTRVYGTTFNVSSYKNENNTSTVLVEGSVGVYKSNNESGERPIAIYPGQRALFDEGSISVEKVNVNKYSSWIKGELLFVNDPFDLILKELERHFDITIDNQYVDLGLKKFTGTFTTESIEEILEAFSAHTPFEYSLKNGVVTLTKK